VFYLLCRLEEGRCGSCSVISVMPSVLSAYDWSFLRYVVLLFVGPEKDRFRMYVIILFPNNYY